MVLDLNILLTEFRLNLLGIPFAFIIYSLIGLFRRYSG